MISKNNQFLSISFQGNSNQYLRKLSIGLTKEVGEKIKPSQLKAVMTKDEFLKIIPKLTEQNYVASAENVKNGTFIADLHSHTNYSDGRILVNDLLEQATEYGNRLRKDFGKFFIFAITDHDGIRGVIEALKIISENPNKFKNIKFIPASELSFLVHCEKNSARAKKYQTDVQMLEALIYNINPFSNTSKFFFENLYSKRKEQENLIIEEAKKTIPDTKFSIQEYANCSKRNKDDYFMMKQHNRLEKYISYKTKLSRIAQALNRDFNSVINEMITFFNSNNFSFCSHNIDLYALVNEWIKLITPPEKELNIIKEKSFPCYQKGKIIPTCEHVYEDIIEYAEKENATLALAHPVYFLQNFRPENCSKMLNKFIKKSNGKLNFIEKFHQAYLIGNSYDIKTREEIDFYNNYLENINLINIGGRDNHSTNFAKFEI